MGKQPVLAYSIAGVAVAIAIAVISASTLGLGGAAGRSDDSYASAAFGVTTASAPVASQGAWAQPAVMGAADVEYVYVDEPGTRHDDDEHEEHERDHDDERGGLFGWLRGEHDDDD